MRRKRKAPQKASAVTAPSSGAFDNRSMYADLNQFSTMAKKMKARRQRRRPAVPVMLEETKGDVVVREEEEKDGGASSKAAVLLPRHLIDEMVWYLGTLECAASP